MCKIDRPNHCQTSEKTSDLISLFFVIALRPWVREKGNETGLEILHPTLTVYFKYLNNICIQNHGYKFSMCTGAVLIIPV